MVGVVCGGIGLQSMGIGHQEVGKALRRLWEQVSRSNMIVYLG